MKKYTQRELDISNQVLSFLLTHRLISVSGLNDQLGLPSTTLQKALENNRIPAKHLFSVIRDLAKYGLIIDGYRIDSDPDSDILTFIKDVGAPKSKEVKTKSGSYFDYFQKQERFIASSLLDILE